ncbi:MAG: tRNA (adenosine(37)-N6)-threonylcarbamoyltransferase complex ATPase subunit type 1 TsaE [Muribaculaceae bacterium]|nr:tRNA (adenosine(37)-N6)-threonylcarbamoyltransferase complex ATPase subunit type 1 TsaE [Muribaculaceae bacterium]
MEMTFTKNQLPEAAKAFVDRIGDRRVFAFYGEMGAGKTTLITEICRLLGVTDDSGSPTFAIVNEYLAANGEPIYHFDFYRIDSPREALDMGAEEYFYSGNICLMEWPERVADILPEDTVDVEIRVNPDDSRTLIMN